MPSTRRVALAVAVVLATTAQIQNKNPLQTGSYPIKHIIIMVQENRSLNHLFNGYSSAFTTRNGRKANGGFVQLQATNNGLVTTIDPGHAYTDYVQDCNPQATPNNSKQCQMNGWEGESCRGGTGCSNVDFAYRYVLPAFIQPYWDIATEGSLSDMTFQSNEGPSFVSHAYTLMSNAHVAAGDNRAASSNVTGGVGGQNAGCNWVGGGNQGEVNTIDMTTTYPASQVIAGYQACLDGPTITDLLDNAGLSWHYIMPAANPVNDLMLWSAPNFIAHICGTVVSSVCTGSEWQNHVVVNDPETEIKAEITGGSLPNVAWVIPTLANSDHPIDNNGGGPDYAARVVNALGGSSYWSNSALCIYWDDWGGWYDFVPSPLPTFNPVDPMEFGFRVPLECISPYSARGTVSHTQRDLSAVNHFIETIFGLPGPIGPFSIEQNTDSLNDMFNFIQSPLSFTPINQI